MIQFLEVRDTQTGKQLVVIQTQDSCFILPSDKEPEEVRIRFVGKRIRTWMKEVKQL